jgi:hypothetical protein
MLPSEPSSPVAVYYHWGVVTMHTNGKVVPLPVIYAVFIREQMFTLGRFSGDWGRRRDAGAFYCVLVSHPSWPWPAYGAYVY